MKRIIVVFACCLFFDNSFAQSMKVIEADLLKAFRKIDYWTVYKSEHGGSDGIVSIYDSLEKSNALFRSKLKYYAEKYPSTLIYEFKNLQNDRLDICSSRDNRFRIYSWDTWQGGTMHDFNNVFQYKVGGITKAFLDTAKNGDDYIYDYCDLYTFKNGNKTYYLAVYLGIYSTKDVGHGIRVFEIENGTLNQSVKLIKTSTGLHDRLYYNYDFFSIVDWKHRPRPTFDAVTKTIKLPLINEKDQVTHKYITYKFTGEYFEKVKS